MTSSPAVPASPVVVVTGANGLVGTRVCAAVVERGGTVRAVVRRTGTAPVLDGIREQVGDFADPAFAASVVEGADAVVTTVHPMGADRATQHKFAVEGTPMLARAARDAGVARFVHVSTCAVYDRGPGTGDVDETSALVDDDADNYAVTKRDTDAALSEVDGLTRVLVRPPAILGPGETSVWNTLRPAEIGDDERQRRTNPTRTFAWVHVDDLASLVADLATAQIPEAADVSEGPVAGGCTVVNVAGEPATARDYVGTVCQALRLAPVWDDTIPAWTGQIRTDLARGWGWTPTARLGWALTELSTGLHGTARAGQSTPTPRSGSFASPVDGLRIATWTWDDVPGEPRGVVQLVHGLAEHGTRYGRVAAALNAGGFLVTATDNRGHGASVSAEVPLGSFGAAGVAGFIGDIVAAGEQLAAEYPDVPLFLVAHSLGSMGAQSVLLDQSARYAGAVLSGSTTLDGLLAVVQSLPADQPGLAAFNTGFEPRTGFEWLSRDAAEVDAYVADPLCGFPTEEAIMGGVLGTAQRTSDPAQLARIRPGLPVLVLSGDRDPVGGPGASNVTALADRYREAGLTDVSVRLYPEARHEVFNETNRDEVTVDLVGWLTEHLPS